MKKNSWPPERVRKLRHLTGMTQKEFANALGVHERTIQSWEIGKRTQTGPNAMLLSFFEDSLFGVTLSNNIAIGVLRNLLELKNWSETFDLHYSVSLIEKAMQPLLDKMEIDLNGKDRRKSKNVR